MRAGLAADFGAVSFASSSSSEELDAELLELRSGVAQAGRWVVGWKVAENDFSQLLEKDRRHKARSWISKPTRRDEIFC